jgi:hypothetical protein
MKSAALSPGYPDRLSLLGRIVEMQSQKADTESSQELWITPMPEMDSGTPIRNDYGPPKLKTENSIQCINSEAYFPGRIETGQCRLGRAGG